MSQMILEHRAWAGLVLGLLAFGESLIIIGAVLPATAMLVLAGGLIGSGALDAGGVVLGATLGTILGDSVSFRIGQVWGPKVLRLKVLQARRPAIAKVSRTLNQYGLATLFLGRFSGPLRAFVPVLAGLSGMPPHRFYPANIVSALAWVLALLTPGYLLGRNRAALSIHDLLSLSLALTLAIAAALAFHRGLRPPDRNKTSATIE
jgi:membrane protein DedA with SNARE-associated domain